MCHNEGSGELQRKGKDKIAFTNRNSGECHILHRMFIWFTRLMDSAEVRRHFIYVLLRITRNSLLRMVNPQFDTIICTLFFDTDKQIEKPSVLVAQMILSLSIIIFTVGIIYTNCLIDKVYGLFPSHFRVSWTLIIPEPSYKSISNNIPLSDQTSLQSDEYFRSPSEAMTYRHSNFYRGKRRCVQIFE